MARLSPPPPLGAQSSQPACLTVPVRRTQSKWNSTNLRAVLLRRCRCGVCTRTVLLRRWGFAISGHSCIWYHQQIFNRKTPTTWTPFGSRGTAKKPTRIVHMNHFLFGCQTWTPFVRLSEGVSRSGHPIFFFRQPLKSSMGMPQSASRPPSNRLGGLSGVPPDLVAGYM